MADEPESSVRLFVRPANLDGRVPSNGQQKENRSIFQKPEGETEDPLLLLNGRLGTRGSLIWYVVISSVMTPHVIDWEHSTVNTQPPKITGWGDQP